MMIVIIYALITLILTPFFFKISMTFLKAFKYTILHQPVFEATYFQILSFVFLYLSFYMYCRRRKGVDLARIWKDRIYDPNGALLRDALLGIVTFFIAFPVVVFADQLSEMFNFLIFQTEAIDQVAVKYLKLSMDFPVLFALALVCVIILAPVIEEFLFRGVFQSFFRPYLGPKASILLSAFIFAFFHFAPSQGVSNFPIMLTLFTFALYLGYIYERQRSLIAPILLHMTFNAVSVIRIALVSG